MNPVAQAEVAEVLEAYADAKNRRDVAAVVDLCHPDGYYESVGMPGRIEGRQALAGFYSQLFTLLPDYRGEFDGQAIQGNTAVVWGRFGGTLSAPIHEGAIPDGRRIEVPVTFVCEIRDGLIYSDVGYFDAGDLYRQAGLPIPSAASILPAAAFVARFPERWSAPDPSRFADLLDPDTRNLYPGMAEPQGPAGVVQWLENAIATFPDLRLEVSRWASDGESVFIEFEASATVDGEQMRWQGADRFLLAGDRCIEGRSYFDTRPLADAIASPGR